MGDKYSVYKKIAEDSEKWEEHHQQEPSSVDDVLPRVEFTRDHERCNPLETSGNKK